VSPPTQPFPQPFPCMLTPSASTWMQSPATWQTQAFTSSLRTATASSCRTASFPLHHSLHAQVHRLQVERRSKREPNESISMSEFAFHPNAPFFQNIQSFIFSASLPPLPPIEWQLNPRRHPDSEGALDLPQILRQ